MKKIITTAVLGLVLFTVPGVSRAATLGELSLKIENLQQEIQELRSQLKGQASGSVPPGGFMVPLKMGSTGPEVIALQEFLAEEGFYGGVTDGVFGSATRNAMNAYKVAIGFQSWGSTWGGTWRVAGDPVTSYTVTTSACKADFDGNGKVEVADFILLQDNLTISPADEQLIFDIKVDGVVNLYDIKEWMTQYGKTNFCTASSVSSESWMQSIVGTSTPAPAASVVPAGSDWNAEEVGATSASAWLWDYQITKILTYTRRQINVYDGSGTPNAMWVAEPLATSNVTLLAQTFADGYDSVETKNGKMYLIQNVSGVSYNGLQYEMLRKYELTKPAASANQTTSIDMVYEQVGDTLEGKIYINKKPLASYNGVLPKFFTYFANDAKWMMTMRVLNDGPIENTSVLGVSDNAPEAAYTFESITDSKLQAINVVQGSSSFNPTMPPDYYNPTTNTITLKPNQGQVVWFHLFMKPPFTFPTGFTGIGETKTYATDFAINLHRDTAVIQNGQFVFLADQN